jgi:putative acetyltransferase
MEIIAVTAPTQEVHMLVNELNGELGALYTPEQRHGLALEAIFQPHIRFFIARRDGGAVACGGVALFPDFAEVKRMYVRTQARGQGVADAIMARLIAETHDAGLSILRLETGTQSPAALHFYRRHGFRDCAAFEPYASLPPHRVAASVFLERDVS